jgi:hypothetical protein
MEIGFDIDHNDRNKLNNSVSNLRYLTRQQQGINRGQFKNNKSGVKGVHYDNQNKKWKAQIRVNNIPYYLGIYENKIDAISARVYAEKLIPVFRDYQEKHEFSEIETPDKIKLFVFEKVKDLIK